jgi:hypothetical protein
MMRIVFAIAGVAAALCFAVSPSLAQSYGNAPWCAVVDQGGGDVAWDCEYQTMQQCAPSIVGGNRGFCNLNPTYVPPQWAPRQRH